MPELHFHMQLRWPFSVLCSRQRNRAHAVLCRSIDLTKWSCKIPGKADTDWAGGLYPLSIVFSEEYPTKPPMCKFPAGFFHPNVYPSGQVCLSIINEELSHLSSQLTTTIIIIHTTQP
eukprot:GHUV01035914.1.p1 GENE.GHUV01035914.1~~GHUV01035914.1.p1  ORF type:complete len:118 (+),score=4.77 GHUV01035914.1:368-721(+)